MGDLAAAGAAVTAATRGVDPVGALEHKRRCVRPRRLGGGRTRAVQAWIRPRRMA